MTSHVSCFYELLLADHRRTERLLVELSGLIQAGQDWPSIQAAASTLIQELAIHFACEEYGLFPVLSLYKTMVLMEAEHDALLAAQARFSEALEKSLAQQDASPDLAEAFLQWAEQLRAHIYEEEHGVFPMAQTLLEPEEKALVQRKLHETLEQVRTQGEAILKRPTPTCRFSHPPLFMAPQKPLAYDNLFEADHASLHHIRMKAGQRFKRHWGPEHQCLLVLSGCVDWVGDAETRRLEPGDQVIMEPRFPYALAAQTDCHLLVFKVWPRPHFLRSPS